MKRTVRLSLVAIVLIAQPLLRAQEVGAQERPAPLSREARPDTSVRPFSAALREASIVGGDSSLTSSRAGKSTGTAMILSAILPGAGQVYNESYWKAPIVLGLGIYFLSELLSNNRLYVDYADKYSVSQSSASGADPYMLRLREFYRDQRDTFGWYYLILYVLNIVDAYVDASLFDFNVKGDLSLRSIPDQHFLPQPGVRLKLQYRF